MQEMATRTEPNLGRPNTRNQSASAQGSVTPLLNADVQSNNLSSDQLSPADIRGTSRSSEAADVAKPADTNRAGVRVPRRPASNPAPLNPGSIDRPDPLAGYRTNSTGALTYSYRGSSGLPTGAAPSRTYSYNGARFTPNDTRPDGPSSVKSSIVFVRASGRLSEAVGSVLITFRIRRYSTKRQTLATYGRETCLNFR
jgi:hypothetical protein